MRATCFDFNVDPDAHQWRLTDLKIKPCPLCGASAQGEGLEGDHVGECFFWIQCPGCGLYIERDGRNESGEFIGGKQSHLFQIECECIWAWNMRFELAGQRMSASKKPKTTKWKGKT